jgi:hypothetical protein
MFIYSAISAHDLSANDDLITNLASLGKVYQVEPISHNTQLLLSSEKTMCVDIVDKSPDKASLTYKTLNRICNLSSPRPRHNEANCLERKKKVCPSLY